MQKQGPQASKCVSPWEWRGETEPHIDANPANPDGVRLPNPVIQTGLEGGVLATLRVDWGGATQYPLPITQFWYHRILTVQKLSNSTLDFYARF